MAARRTEKGAWQGAGHTEAPALSDLRVASDRPMGHGGWEKGEGGSPRLQSTRFSNDQPICVGEERRLYSRLFLQVSTSRCADCITSMNSLFITTSLHAD